MPSCNVTADIERIRKMMKSLGIQDTAELNDLLLSSLYMEASSFVGFLNVIIGYFITRWYRDAVCSMCKEEEPEPDGNNEVNGVSVNSWVTAHRDPETLEYFTPKKVTKTEKQNLCLLIQYLNSLTACPITSPQKEDNTSTYSRMLNSSMSPFGPLGCCLPK